MLVALGSGGALSPGSGGTPSLDIPFSSSLAGRVPFNSSLAGWVFHGNGEALSLDNRGALSLGIPFNSSLAGWVPFNSSLAGWVFHEFSNRSKLVSMITCTCSAIKEVLLLVLICDSPPQILHRDWKQKSSRLCQWQWGSPGGNEGPPSTQKWRGLVAHYGTYSMPRVRF